jgi:non-lysosomal glucosylceramidase
MTQKFEVNRREFIKMSGACTVGTGLLGSSAYAALGVKEADVVDKYARLIPADKGLSPEWVRSLTARGLPQAYRERAALDHIGMPVGGLFAGTVYLGGDGRLWLWNVLNDDREGIVPRSVPYKGKNLRIRDGANYAGPAPRSYPFEQNFGVRVDGKLRTLDADGFEKVSFKGQYPIGEVTYEDSACPISARLSAYSPFIPLNTPDSSLPATIMSYTLRNSSDRKVDCDLFGWLENPVCLRSGRNLGGHRHNRIVSTPSFTALDCTAASAKGAGESARPDSTIEAFEGETYGEWTATGTAFGNGPILISDVPGYQGDLGATGTRVVNSHATAPGKTTDKKDGAVGTLTSPPFTVTHTYINILVGGGAHAGQTCVNVRIGDNVIGSVTGDNNNSMRWKSIAVGSHKGEQATIEIVDSHTDGWGNIGVDQIVQSDNPVVSGSLEDAPDFGSMSLSVLDGSGKAVAAAGAREPARASDDESESGSLTDSVVGSVGRTLTLKPGEEQTVDFVITWHFPNLTAGGMKNVGREYASRFENALGVARYVAKEFDRLSADTHLWRDTWYDSSLPYWFLDRTMANTSILATTTAYRFKDGRFWAWEGVGCCHGTCTHVWHYAQAPGRLFPDVERRQREEVDFGIALHKDGGIGMRANLKGANHPADDGQCGRILGAYREHQMCEDDAFLKRTWPNIKKAILFMIKRDANRDGILEGAQHNTLDAAWYGRISFLASLYLATLRAGEAMAIEVGDAAFADECKRIAEKGAETILELYNGEYFFHELDPKHIDNVAVGTGCYVDQVFGQFWAHQVGLGHLFDEAKTKSALKALYKYNFVPHIGNFRDTFTRGRWYANEEDKGLIMCSWPKGGLNEKWHKAWQFQYFNECMSGFEWQAAAHMISEGLIEEGMAVSRAIHDRYDAHLRNPYNEIECSDHYSRAMASYGAFLAAGGYESHGPKGYLAFSPKVHDGDTFKCAFTAAGGWGAFEQTATGGSYYAKATKDKSLKAEVAVKWGSVTLTTLGLDIPATATTVTVSLNGKVIPASLKSINGKQCVILEQAIELKSGQILTIHA